MDAKKENNKMSIYEKLSKARNEMGAITKNKTNPHFKSKYADINQCLAIVEPCLHENRVLLTQPISVSDGRTYITTILYDLDSGEALNSLMLVPECPTPQAYGSAITYFRRYTLISLLALEVEDEDGNEASKPAPKAKTKKFLYDIAELLDSENKEEVLTYLKKNGVSVDLDKKIATSLRELEKLKKCDYETIEY